MKSTFPILLTLMLLASGCSRSPDIKAVVKGNGAGTKQRDVFSAVLESFRYNSGSGDDWTRFRDGLQTLDGHFSKPDVVTRVRLSASDRKFLEGEVHLTPAEFAEIEPLTFRAADAHHLDECFLLRDVARSLEVGNLTPIEQAHRHFRWVMRNVLLHEQVDEWTPPAYTLRRGHGSAIDRALVFLALLRQARMEGCLIVTPDSDPPHALVGVLEPKTSNVRLFDPRLGLPVASANGKSIATLQEAVAAPSLLAPSGITAEQTKKLEAWLACPLFALSPRMQEVQERLNPYDPIALYMNAAALHQEFAKATQLPVKVWNPPAQGKKPANSPTRSLWMFLPKQEGGIDDGTHTLRYMRARLAFASVEANWATINLGRQFMPQHAWLTLMKISEDLFNKYDVQPREMYLRGQRESVARRLERMTPFLDNALVGLEKDAAFVTVEIPRWVESVKNVYAAVDLDDPKQREAGQKAIRMIWSQDLFLSRLIDVDKDEEFDRKDKMAVLSKRTILTKILAVGTRDHFASEMARTQAAANQEAAERAQAMLDATTKPSEHARANAANQWLGAASEWSGFYLPRVSLQAKLDRGLAHLQRFPAERRVELLESLHLDVHKYVQAKLRLAECKVHTEPTGPKAAASYFEDTRREVESMERRGLLKAEVEDLTQKLRGSPLRARLDMLAADWSERGNYYWTKQHIDRRIAELR